MVKKTLTLEGKRLAKIDFDIADGTLNTSAFADISIGKSYIREGISMHGFNYKTYNHCIQFIHVPPNTVLLSKRMSQSVLSQNTVNHMIKMFLPQSWQTEYI